MLKPQIIDKPEFSVVGLEASFIHALSADATNLEVIGPLWDRLFQRADQIPNRFDGAMFGIIGSCSELERKHPDELQYLAGVRVSSTSDIPVGMVARTVPACSFAVFTHQGPIRLIRDTVTEIYRVWLPQSGYQHAGIADVELYDERFRCDSEESTMEYWISVTPAPAT